MGISIIGTGASLGELEVSNAEVEQVAGIESGWIKEKIGIISRRHAKPDQSVESLARIAMMDALGQANQQIEDLDFIFSATYAHERIFPSLASRLLISHNQTRTQTFDIQSNCTGFINALLCAHDRLIADSNAQAGLALASERNSDFIDPSDINTTAFFSDGAGAAVVARSDGDSGVLSRSFLTDASNSEAVRLDWLVENGNEEKRDRAGKITMNGIATWRQAVTLLPKVLKESVEKASLSLEDIDHFVFHQANYRLLEYLIKKLRLDPERVPLNVHLIGNTGAASIPIILNDLVVGGRIQKGQKVAFTGVGAGFNYVSTVWKW